MNDEDWWNSTCASVSVENDKFRRTICGGLSSWTYQKKYKLSGYEAEKNIMVVLADASGTRFWKQLYFVLIPFKNYLYLSNSNKLFDSLCLCDFAISNNWVELIHQVL